MQPMRVPFIVSLFAVGLTLGMGSRPAAGQSKSPVQCSDPKAGICAGVDLSEGRFLDLPPDVLANDFRLSPPQVTALSAKKAAGSNGTLVRVAFAKDKRLGPTLILGQELEKEAMVLHDDGLEGDERAGDGVYALSLPLPFETLVADQSVLADALRKNRIVALPVFEGRQLVKQMSVAEFGLHDGVLHILPPGSLGMLASPSRTLLVDDPAVIGDPTRTFDGCTGVGNPDGVWTFNHLMQEMANPAATGLDPETMAREWFGRWIGDEIEPELRDRLWPASWNLAHAPFRLVAIVNRIDLASNPTAYGGAAAGGGGAEGRFVFELCTRSRKDTAIFEYGIPRSGCPPIRDWAQSWLELDALVPGTDAYDAALELLTEEFVRHGAGGSKPNGSALNQLRTDGFIHHQGGRENWRLREWRIQHDGEGPTSFTVAQTPESRFNGTAPLGTWINLEESAILAGTHQVGEFFSPIDPTVPFRGTSGESFILDGPPPRGSFWDAPGITSPQARHRFSLATCDGCHTRETETPFFHLMSSGFRSGFLTGIDVVDPVVSSTVRHFEDLTRRAQSLAALAGASCRADLPHRPVGFGPRFRPRIGEGNLPLPPITYRPLLAPH